MRRAFAKCRQVRENTAQLGRPASSIWTDGRKTSVFNRTLALSIGALSIGIPAVIRLAAFSVGAIGGG